MIIKNNVDIMEQDKVTIAIMTTVTDDDNVNCANLWFKFFG